MIFRRFRILLPNRIKFDANDLKNIILEKFITISDKDIEVVMEDETEYD